MIINYNEMEDKWAQIRKNRRSVFFTWWPHRSTEGKDSTDLCGFLCALFAPTSFFKLSFGDIIYQTGLLLAQTAGFRHTKSLFALFFSPAALYLWGDEFTHHLKLIAAGYRRQTYDLLMCVYVCELISAVQVQGFLGLFQTFLYDFLYIIICFLLSFTFLNTVQ